MLPYILSAIPPGGGNSLFAMRQLANHIIRAGMTLQQTLDMSCSMGVLYREGSYAYPGFTAAT